MAKQDEFARYTIRVPADLYEKLGDAALESNRSVNAEIIERLEDSFVDRSAATAEVINQTREVAGLLVEALKVKGQAEEQIRDALQRQIDAGDGQLQSLQTVLSLLVHSDDDARNQLIHSIRTTENAFDLPSIDRAWELAREMSLHVNSPEYAEKRAAELAQRREVTAQIKASMKAATERMNALTQMMNQQKVTLSEDSSAISGEKQKNTRAKTSVTIKVAKHDVRTLAGRRGQNLQEIARKSNTNIDVLDDGIVRIEADDTSHIRMALSLIHSLMPIQIKHMRGVQMDQLSFDLSSDYVPDQAQNQNG